MTACWVMSENQFNRIEMQLFALEQIVRDMRKSTKKEELLKGIRDVRATLNNDENVFEVNTNDRW